MKVYGNLDLKGNSILNCDNLQPAQNGGTLQIDSNGVASVKIDTIPTKNNLMV